MIPTIRIGNDFSLTLFIHAFDGSLIDLTGAESIKICASLNGSRYTTIQPQSVTVFPDKLLLHFNAQDTPRAGDYRIIVRYRFNDVNYLAEASHAFSLSADVEFTNNYAATADVSCRVQFSANGTNGLSAYEIAVLNGYNGTYDQWVNYYTKPIQMKTINGVPLSGEGDIEQPVHLSVWREHVMTRRINPEGEYDEPSLDVTHLRYQILGALDPDKTYYLRLMRKVRKGTLAGVGGKRGQSWRLRKSGWCAVSAAGSELAPDRPIYRNENLLQNHLQYPLDDKDGIVRYTDIYGNIRNLWPGLLLQMFRTYDDDEVQRFPFYKTRKLAYEEGVNGGDSIIIWSFNHLGLALWEYNDEGKAVRQVSNVARIGIAYNPQEVLGNDANDDNTWWAIP